MSGVTLVRATELPPQRRTPSGIFAVAPVVPFASPERVARLLASWRDESRYLSWMDDILACRSARALAHVGRDAVPHLSRALEGGAEGSGLVIAILREIVGGPAIPTEVRGDRDAERERWRAWLREQGTP